MQEVPDPAQLQRLEREARALRRLARALVRDASAADDLVQEAWLAGLLRGQQGTNFLRGAVRRLALGWRRAAARRVEQEQASPAERRAAQPDEIAERLELSELVLRTLRGLPEPYRSTLTLHFFDGLAASEIAQRCGVPAGTVRARIARGLAELRLRFAAQLDRAERDWRVALLPIAGLAPAARIAWSTGTIMGMKWALACAATAVLALFGWIAWRGDAAPLSLPGMRGGSAPNRAGSVAVDPANPAGSADERRVAGQLVDPAAGRAGTRVLARAVDEDGRALAGATLVLDGGAASADSDSQGRLLLELPASSLPASNSELFACRFEARAPGRLLLARSVNLHAGEDNWLGDLELDRAGRLRGRVCDEHGNGLAAARVFATQESVDEHCDPWMGPGRSLLQGALVASCAADGSFVFPALGEGWWILWATDSGREWKSSERIAVRGAEESPGITLQLGSADPARALAGCVLDPQGRACERALVEWIDEQGRSSWDRQLRTRADGRFEFRTREPHELLRIRATDAERRYEEIVREIQSGEAELRLQFPAPLALTLRVVDEQGAGIADANVSAHSTQTGFLFPGCHARSDASGRATLRLPAQEFEVDVVAQGYERAGQGPFDPGAGARELEFRLARGAGLRGRVVAAGEGIAGAELVLLELSAPGVRWAPCDEWMRPGGWVESVQPTPVWRTRSGASGDFTLGVPLGARPGSSGRYVVLAQAAGWAPSVLGPLQLDAHSQQEGLQVELERGGAIEGCCISTRSDRFAGWRVLAANGLGCRREALVDPAGRFRFQNLTPGRWQLAPQPPGSASEWGWYENDEVPPARTQVEVQSGLTAAARCELFEFEPHLLEGRFEVHADPPGIWSVQIERILEDGERERASARTLLRLDSTFKLQASAPGRYRLLLECTDSRWGSAQVSDVVELGPQPLRWSGELAFSRLNGRVGPDTQLLYAFAHGPGDLRAATCFQPGPAGAIGERWIPSGHLLITDEPHPPGDAIEHPLATLDVRENETATLPR